MTNLVPVTIRHRTNAVLTYPSKLAARTLGFSERMTNALKFLGLFWLAAVAFVFVPVLHFFLVPLALIGGLVVFVQKIRLHSYLETGMIHCPNCQAEMPLKARPFNWPAREFCGRCRTDVVIERSSSS